MGIPGLLVALKSVTYPVHISEYRGLTAGVDAYCWLHRGAFSCGTEICTGLATNKYVTFCMKRVNLLRQHGVEPIMVFDGASLPLKGNKHAQRRRQRDDAKTKGAAALAAGEAGAAAQHFSKAVAVTYEMAFALVKELTRCGVKLIVAPFEADAQLAYLNRRGAVDVVITEDSDCLPYGCRKVLFKMDNEGHGQEIQLRNLSANTPLTLCKWKNSMFLDLCLLVGCDYITSSVKGLGITTAHDFVQRHRSLDKIMRAVEASKFVVPEGYWQEYKRARLAFRHHIVYDPQTRKALHLMPLGDTAKDVSNLDFLGPHLPAEIATGIATGRLHPVTHQPQEGFPAAPLLPVAETQTPIYGPDLRPKTPQVVGLEGQRELQARSVDRPAESAADGPENCDESVEASTGERGGPDAPLASMTLPLAHDGLGGTIERPFADGRRALAELWRPPHGGTAQGVTRWGTAAMCDTGKIWDARKKWSRENGRAVLQQGPRDSGACPPEHDSPRGEPGSCEIRSGLAEDGCESGFSGSERHRNRGLDLTRVRETEHNDGLGQFRPALSLFAEQPSSPAVARQARCFGATAGHVLRPMPLPGGHANGNSLLLERDCHPRRGQSTHETAVAPAWGMASLPPQDVDPSLKCLDRSVWEKLSSADRIPREGHIEVSSEASSDGLGVGRVQQEAPSACGAFGWTLDALSLRDQANRSEKRHLSEGSADRWGEECTVGHEKLHASEEAEARQRSGALALMGSLDADRAKLVPVSAQDFHSTQVSEELQTLHRRKRRLTSSGHATPPPPALAYASDHMGCNEQKERDLNSSGYAMGGFKGACARGHEGIMAAGAWMVQTDAGRAAGEAHDESGAKAEGRSVCGRGSADTSHSSGARALVVPSRRISGSPAAIEPSAAGDTGRVGAEGYACPGRWTTPLRSGSSASRASRAELPLLRHLAAEGNDSGHGRATAVPWSRPPNKRMRGTDFWDAQLLP